MAFLRDRGRLTKAADANLRMALRIADLFSQLEDLAESKDTKMRVDSTLTAEFIGAPT